MTIASAVSGGAKTAMFIFKNAPGYFKDPASWYAAGSAFGGSGMMLTHQLYPEYYQQGKQGSEGNPSGILADIRGAASTGKHTATVITGLSGAKYPVIGTAGKFIDATNLGLQLRNLEDTFSNIHHRTTQEQSAAIFSTMASIAANTGNVVDLMPVYGKSPAGKTVKLGAQALNITWSAGSMWMDDPTIWGQLTEALQDTGQFAKDMKGFLLDTGKNITGYLVNDARDTAIWVVDVLTLKGELANGELPADWQQKYQQAVNAANQIDSSASTTNTSKTSSHTIQQYRQGASSKATNTSSETSATSSENKAAERQVVVLQADGRKIPVLSGQSKWPVKPTPEPIDATPIVELKPEGRKIPVIYPSGVKIPVIQPSAKKNPLFPIDQKTAKLSDSADAVKHTIADIRTEAKVTGGFQTTENIISMIKANSNTALVAAEPSQAITTGNHVPLAASKTPQPRAYAIQQFRQGVKASEADAAKLSKTAKVSSAKDMDKLAAEVVTAFFQDASSVAKLTANTQAVLTSLPAMSNVLSQPSVLEKLLPVQHTTLPTVESINQYESPSALMRHLSLSPSQNEGLF